MKLIGFIKEHNNIKEAKYFENIKKISITTSKKNEILHYLSNGILVFSWMGYFKDLENGNLISPDSYYTDGIYIWPKYFPYYLQKYQNYKIDRGFTKHMATKPFYNVSYDDLKKLEGLLARKLNEL